MKSIECIDTQIGIAHTHTVTLKPNVDFTQFDIWIQDCVRGALGKSDETVKFSDYW